MHNAASPDTTPGVVAMGLTQGLVVQELGWDSDVDEGLRDRLMDAIDGDLIVDAVESVDVVVLWWRSEDGDLTDGLVDSLTDLGPSGVIWLLTPKVGREGYVDHSDIAEGALVAGLSLTTSAKVSHDWQAHKLVRPKGGRK